MTQEEMENLRVGEVVQSQFSGMGYIISEKKGTRFVAKREVCVTNHDEWNLVEKVKPDDTPQF
jgi:hypothetical protein